MNRKKLVGWIISGVLAVGAIGGATAGVVIANHEHKYSTEWTFDEVNHWHNATCSHEEQISGLEAHSWDEGVVTEPSCTAKGFTTFTCTVCGATKTGNVTEMLPHSFGDGVTTYSTCTTLGNITKTCSVCGGKDITPLAEYGDHIFSNTWTKTSTHHFKTATCGHVNEISRNEEHTFITYYSNVNGSLMKHDECNICHYAKEATPMTIGIDYQEIDASILAEVGTKKEATLDEANTVYVLKGEFPECTLTISGENITVIGLMLTSSDLINFKFSDTASNTVIYGFNTNTGSVSNFVSDVTFVKCNFASTYVTFKNESVDVSFDNCYLTGDNALYFEYFKATPNCSVSITNCTIDATTSYSLFFYGKDATPESGFASLSKIIYENNQSINGWGTKDNKPKRTVFKFHHDQKYAHGDNGDTTDTNQLTPDAKAFVEYVLTSGNTFDNAGYNVSLFNFDNIYFSDVNWKHWEY